MVKMNYPEWADNDMKKIYFLYRVKQRMKNHYNDMGNKYRTSQISKKTWDEYKHKWDRWNHKLMHHIANKRNDLENDETIQINLENVFSDE